MRTTTSVHSKEERAMQRRRGENLARRSLWRLIFCVNVLLTAVTRILPMAGASAWWVTALCFVPGLCLYWLGCAGAKGQALRGKAVCLLASAGLLLTCVSGMMGLITLFTEGVGTVGTQITMALAAAGLLLLCMKGDGLARGCYFLRRPLLIALATVLAGHALMDRMDGLFPLLGGGTASLLSAGMAGVGVGWPLVLALLEEPAGPRRWTEPLAPCALCVVCVLCLNLALPHELWTNRAALADCMVLTVGMLPPALRLAALCLWMVGLFLLIGGCAKAAARYMLAPWGREVAWLPGVLTVLAAASQMAPVPELWRAMGKIGPWLLIVPGTAAILAFGRKKQ